MRVTISLIFGRCGYYESDVKFALCGYLQDASESKVMFMAFDIGKMLSCVVVPKVIYYCWFGPNPQSELVKNAMKTWQLNLNDYEIRLINEETFDVKKSSFTEKAYNLGKFAFVSDYARAEALWEHGGIYLDTDVKINHSLDDFLHHRAFSGFERVGLCFTAVWGSEKGHSWPREVLDYYDNQIEYVSSEYLFTNTEIVSTILSEKYGINRFRDTLQVGNEGVVIYPSSTFCLDLPKNYATHLFNGSWVENKGEKEDYGESLLREWHLRNALNRSNKTTSLLILLVRIVGKKELLCSLVELAKKHLKYTSKKIIGKKSNDK